MGSMPDSTKRGAPTCPRHSSSDDGFIEGDKQHPCLLSGAVRLSSHHGFVEGDKHNPCLLSDAVHLSSQNLIIDQKSVFAFYSKCGTKEFLVRLSQCIDAFRIYSTMPIMNSKMYIT